LQELLAPTRIKFHKQSWTPMTPALNNKVHDNELGVPLWKAIAAITGIPFCKLLSFLPGIQNIRQRMSWASKRKTTRIEDMVYCLIGMLDVSLSIAYSEGHMVFYRLQLQVMQHSDDKSLFAWQGEPSPPNSMLAAAPKCFVSTDSNSLMTESVEELSAADRPSTYALTNIGLHLWLRVYEVQHIVLVDQDGQVDKYTLEVEGLEKITGVQGLGTEVLCGQPASESRHLKIAILGDFHQREVEKGRMTSKAILLIFGPDKQQYKNLLRGLPQSISLQLNSTSSRSLYR
jgi:hypothetical protein